MSDYIKTQRDIVIYTRRSETPNRGVQLHSNEASRLSRSCSRRDDDFRSRNRSRHRSRSRYRSRSRSRRERLQALEDEKFDLEMELLRKKHEKIERSFRNQHRRSRQLEYGESSQFYDQQAFYNLPQYEQQDLYDQPYHNQRSFYSSSKHISEDNKVVAKQYAKRQLDISQREGEPLQKKPTTSWFPSTQKSTKSNEPVSLQSQNASSPSQYPTVEMIDSDTDTPLQLSIETLPPTPQQGNPEDNLIHKEQKPVTEASPTKREFEQADIILRSDEVPTRQMTSRLETALGLIMKELKEEYGKTEPVIRNKINKIIKQAVRERIKAVMLGESVNSCHKVHAAYRAAYSIKSDIEIINVAFKKKYEVIELNPSAIIFKPAEEPQNYVKLNFKKLLASKCTEMFTELQKLYINNSPSDAYNNVVIGSNDENTDKPYYELTATQKLKRCNDVVHKAMNKHLPKLLSENIAKIMDFLDGDKTFENLKSIMVAEANELMTETRVREFEEIQADPLGEQEIQADLIRKQQIQAYPIRKQEIQAGPIRKQDIQTFKPSMAKENFVPWKYCAKLTSNPYLPKKEEMQNIMTQFQYIGVKKPKSAPKMLLVGFDEKEPYDKFLAANGMTYESFTFNICPAKRHAPDSQSAMKYVKKQNTAINEKMEIVIDNEEKLDVISPELENQITDFLSSIKNDEKENVDSQLAIERARYSDVSFEETDNTFAENACNEQASKDLKNTETITDENVAEKIL